MHTSINSENDVVKMIEKNLSLFDSFEQVYLFGSSLRSTIDNNDIDILVIYSEYSKQISSDLRIIAKKLGRESGRFIDLTALSEEEEKETGFVERIKPYYLKLK